MKKFVFLLLLFVIITFNLMADERYTIGDDLMDVNFSETSFSVECDILGIYPLNDTLYMLELGYRDFTTYKLCLSKDSIAFYESESIDAKKINKPSENWSDTFYYYQLFAMKVVDIGNNYIILRKEKINKIKVMKIDKITYNRTAEVIDFPETNN